jgi:hypothetical protein
MSREALVNPQQMLDFHVRRVDEQVTNSIEMRGHFGMLRNDDRYDSGQSHRHQRSREEEFT